MKKLFKTTWIIAFLILFLLASGIFTYKWRTTKEELVKRTGEIENSIEQLKIQRDKVKHLEKQLEKIGILKTIESEDFSIKYFDNIWQFEKESPLGFYIDGQLIHKKLEYCKVWIGSDGWGGPCEGLAEKDCKTISNTGDRALQLNKAAYVIYRISDIKRKEEQIFSHGYYTIYLRETKLPLYTFELFTNLLDKEQCIGDFEEILKTFELN
jgi:hypothetical protein